MRRLFRLVIRLLLAAVVLVVLAIVFRNPVLRLVGEWQIEKEIGLPTILGRIRVGIMSPVVRIENLRLMNSKEWGGAVFLDLPEVELEYARTGLLFREVRLRRARFQLNELHIIQKADGTTNAQAVRDHLERRRLAQRLEEAGFDFDGIESLTCSFGRFRWTTYEPPPRTREVYVGAHNVTATDIRSLRDVGELLGRAARQRNATLAIEYFLSL